MAGEDVRMAEEELRAKEQEIVAKVKSAYADYFMASKGVEIDRELLDLLGHTTATCGRIVSGRAGTAAGYHQGATGTNRTLE